MNIFYYKVELTEHANYKTCTLGVPDDTVGKPYPLTQVQIRDLDTLELLGPNKRGEIFAKGAAQFTCYDQNTVVSKTNHYYLKV